MHAHPASKFGFFNKPSVSALALGRWQSIAPYFSTESATSHFVPDVKEKSYVRRIHRIGTGLVPVLTLVRTATRVVPTTDFVPDVIALTEKAKFAKVCRF